MKEKNEIILEGIAASPGKVSGKVSIISSPKEVDKIKEDNILVSTHTSPLYTKAMFKASAYITDRGGRMTHAAIVAREMGVPCVVGTEKATKILEEDQEVIVDGNNGEIRG